MFLQIHFKQIISEAELLVISWQRLQSIYSVCVCWQTFKALLFLDSVH